MQAAVWYWVHGSVSVEIDEAEEAVATVRAMSDAGDCAPIGVQYEDGTLHEWKDDPIRKRQDDKALEAIYREFDNARALPPRPVYEVPVPFPSRDGRALTARVWDTPPPPWVGTHKRASR